MGPRKQKDEMPVVNLRKRKVIGEVTSSIATTNTNTMELYINEEEGKVKENIKVTTCILASHISTKNLPILNKASRDSINASPSGEEMMNIVPPSSDLESHDTTAFTKKTTKIIEKRKDKSSDFNSNLSTDHTSLPSKLTIVPRIPNSSSDNSCFLSHFLLPLTPEAVVQSATFKTTLPVKTWVAELDIIDYFLRPHELAAKEKYLFVKKPSSTRDSVEIPLVLPSGQNAKTRNIVIQPRKLTDIAQQGHEKFETLTTWTVTADSSPRLVQKHSASLNLSPSKLSRADAQDWAFVSEACSVESNNSELRPAQLVKAAKQNSTVQEANDDLQIDTPHHLVASNSSAAQSTIAGSDRAVLKLDEDDMSLSPSDLLALT